MADSTSGCIAISLYLVINSISFFAEPSISIAAVPNCAADVTVYAPSSFDGGTNDG